MPLTSDTLERLGTPKDRAARYVPLLDTAMREFGITTQVRARMFLAQVAHESDGLTAFEERASGAEYEGNKVLGNTQRGDGVRFKGRGPIQLTGRWNYTHYAKLLGVDIVAHPQLAAEPRYAFRLSACYFDDRGCNTAADRGDFREVTRRINTALLHYDRRLALYEKLSDCDCVPGSSFLERGDHGDGVVTLTRRLSFVRSKATGRHYLDGKRRRFDGATEKALRAFQQEHGLTVDGRLGPKSAKKLATATERERQRRAAAKVVAPAGGGNSKPAPPPAAPALKPTHSDPAQLPALVRQLERLDARTDQAWEAIVAHAHARRAALSALVGHQRRTGGGPGDAAELAELNTILRSIEAKLGTLVDIEQRELAADLAEPVHAPDTAANGAPEPAPAMGAGAPATAAVPTATAPAAAPVAPVAAPKPKPTEGELLERVDHLERALHRTRRALIARYATVDRELARLTPPAPHKPGRRTVPTKPTKPSTPSTPVKPKTPDKPDVRALQTELNRFTQRHMHNVGPLIVDGVQGPATRARIRKVKYWLGYTGPERRKLSAGPELLQRMRHPRSPAHSNPAMLARALKRRRRQRVLARKSSVQRAGVVTFDGKAVAAWIEPHLAYARAHGWKGTIYSGYRTPEHSEEICREKCGAPSCPGRCAGRTSNHSGRVSPSGAVDVSDYVTFAGLMRSSPHKPRIFNDLPTTDPNHFSATGH